MAGDLSDLSVSTSECISRLTDDKSRRKSAIFNKPQVLHVYWEQNSADYEPLEMCASETNDSRDKHVILTFLFHAVVTKQWTLNGL